MSRAARHHAAMAEYDAVIVGSGPNGLGAAITIAREGRSVLVVEAANTVGGGMRSAELTLPGFVHDVCSAIGATAVASPLFRSLPLSELGLEWVQPPAPMAHPLDDGTAAMLERSVDETAAGLGPDERKYKRVFAPLTRGGGLLDDLLGPARIPRHPLKLAGFGPRALFPAARLARSMFDGERARALFAGNAGHAVLPFRTLASASFSLVLTMTAHLAGWPLARGGSQRFADALADYLRSLGGDIQTGARVASLEQLPSTRAVLLDVTPRQVVEIAGDRLPERYRRRLERFRYGAGAFKLDYAIEGPIPWRAAECARAGTVHLGGTLDEIEASEEAWSRGEHSERPFVILAQQSLFDPSRAPEGKHTVWAYCHVPNGSTFDMSERIEAQIERFAPGFGERVLARHVTTPADLEVYNENYVGGDINGGVQDLRQLFTRPVARINPYSTPAKGLYICSSSTPPGGGVHGMCGYFAAKAALRAL